MTTRTRIRRRSLAVAAVAFSLLLAPLGMGAQPAKAAPASPQVRSAKPLTTSPSKHKLVSNKLVSDKLAGPLATKRTGTHSVFVQLSGPGLADVSAAALKKGEGAFAARSVSMTRKRSVRQTTAKVVARAKAEDAQAKVIFSVSNAVPGVAIRANTDALRALASRADVVKISPLVPKKVNNASAAQLTKAVNSWRSPGVTGAGVKVGIIDTGIDYTHADFGGAGTVAGYKAAQASSTQPNRWTPKVAGGYDFAGDDYNAADPAAAVPRPDQNPLDCEGHGTHVAGSVAGYGVNADGTTFRGSYGKLTAPVLNSMRIGPGMAPQAVLFGLRVFGCEGSTDLVIPALDWALDPNGDGQFSDHLDIVNLSLGGDYSAADDPQNAVVDRIAKHGVLPVISAGNNGDLTDTGGSPGNAVRALGVASSVDAFQLRDGLKVNAPQGVAGIVQGQMSAAYDWTTKPDTTGAVATLSTANSDGCVALSAADRAKVSGKVAWLEWDDNDATRRCGSAARSTNVADAGAVGAIFTSARDVFGAGITGSDTIPVLQLPRSDTNKLRPAAVAGTLNVTFAGSLRGTITSVTPALADTLSTFSSRGTHGSPGSVKPDVAAVGDTVTSASVGTGNEQLTISGTSMAAPVTAGIAALVKKRHPTWTPERLKAAVMNTATHDVYTKPGRQGRKYGPARVGAGRVDALAAVTTKVLAYSTERQGSVSTSFGVVEVPSDKKSVSKKQQVRIRNTGSAPVSVRLSYQAVVRQPGVSYRVSPALVRVKARSSVKVTVTMRATSKKLRHSIDPTMTRTQLDAYLKVARSRQYVSDASGRVLIKQSGKATLRVPVYGAAKPVSKTNVVAATVAGAPAIVARGSGVSQGGGTTAFRSLMSVMDLGFTSPRQPSCAGTVAVGCASSQTTRASDLQYVGAGATPSGTGSKADGWLWFGVSTYGNWATAGNTSIPFVEFDTTGDGQPDFQASVQNEPSTDLLTSYLVDLRSGELTDIQPANFVDGNLDTNVFDTNTILIPVRPAAIGLTDAMSTFPITYYAGTFNAQASALSGNVQDLTPAIAFDVAAPDITVAGPLYEDTSGVAIEYRLSPSVGSTKALILHLHGRSGFRAEVLPLSGRVSLGANQQDGVR